MAHTLKPVLPGDAFFLLRPTPVEARAMRIVAMPLSAEFGGVVADEFHLTLQRASGIAPQYWEPLLGELHSVMQNCRPFKLETVGLWRFFSQFRQNNALFWTMRTTPALLEMRQSLDTVLLKYGATLSPWPLAEWKPHTLALQNVQGIPSDLSLPPGIPRPSFTVHELWLSVYQPWGGFVDHPIIIFDPDAQEMDPPPTTPS
ncbi:MAG: hypothetical protein H0T73_07530 [Ardenticatenales bacterium]|nr:hypothetical protein [Ardenticatenales bacterium]